MFKIRFNKKIAFSNNSNLRFSACPGLVFWQARVVRRRFFIFSNHKKGVVLLIVLGTLLVVASLVAVILSLILSHARHTHHQTSRIQAYYAAQAGMNLALEQLRVGPPTGWTTGTYHLCKSGCSSPDINDWDIPYPVTITIYGLGTSIDGVGRRITITTTYTYTP